MRRTAIVAALKSEVAPLIRDWSVRFVDHAGKRYQLFESGHAALLCAGIGPEAARRATEAIIQEFQPSHILSVGFVGALDPNLRVVHLRLRPCSPRRHSRGNRESTKHR